jgi:hypothetical protein
MIALQSESGQGGSIMYTVGVIAIVAVVLYLAFMAVDGFGLPEQSSKAKVVGKEFVEAGSTYATQIIGGQRIVQQQARPEMYVLILDVLGDEAPVAVEQEFFGSTSEGDEVEVTFQIRRITGRTQVIDVRR